MRKNGTKLSALLLLASASVTSASAAGRVPVVTTSHFAFHSDFATNLNDALIAAGLARKKHDAELFRSGDEVGCFDKLPPPERAAWNAAVDYYAQIISPAGWMAREQFLLRLELVGFDPEPKAQEDKEFVDIARNLRAAAGPAYAACRWPAQDAKNRRWIAELETRLTADEERAASRVQQLYQKKWKTLPILVDVVETVDWSGANTSWSDAGQGDVLIASSPGGPAAFEILFHESSHVLMDRHDPVRQALDDAAKAADFNLPRDLWHVVLFYTTGEAMRPILNERDASPYTPMLYAIFDRGSSWKEYREALENCWRPYVDGKRTVNEAAADLVGALRKRP